MTMENIQDTLVLYPYPGIGHLISMVELGKLILHHHSRRFAITVLLTTGFAASPSVTSYIGSISRSNPSISFRRFPQVSVDTANPPRSHAAVAFDFIRKNSANVLQSLRDISAASTVRALIIDFFCTSALPIAKELNIPTYYFYTSGASALAAFFYFPRLFKNSTKSFKDQDGVVLEFPGLPSLKATQMPEPTLDQDDPAYGEMWYFCDHLTKADGILVNTFEALEPKAVELIPSGACVPDAPTPLVYCIGPLIADESSRAGDSTVGGQQDCMSWLEKQPRKSVVFLCFGSRGTFSAEQIKEMAVGLEKSGHRFLWVVKNPSGHDQHGVGNVDVDLEALMPEGFLERTKERGMVVRTWAPQVAVLRKEAVVGFVTHCGWNSVLEAVAAGVALVAWPLYAEQHMNRNFLVQDMEMAIGVEQRDGDGFVSKVEVERVVRELMESERGRKLREKSQAMRERAAQALGDFGSSTKAMAKLAEIWSRPPKQPRNTEMPPPHASSIDERVVSLASGVGSS